MSLVLGVFIGVLSVLGWHKCCNKSKESDAPRSQGPLPDIPTDDAPAEYAQLERAQDLSSNQNQVYSQVLPAPLREPTYDDPEFL